MNTRLTVATPVATVLTSMALYPLLWGLQWFWAGAGAVLVVGLVGALTRWRPVPWVLCFAAAMAGELLYLNAVFAGSQSWGGVIPTRSSLHHLAVLVTQARGEMARYAPPVPEVHGILLLTVAGIGFVGALTDLLAVRLRRPAVAGLPLLVLYCAPLTTDARATWADGTIVFCLSVAGYLGLLSADSRDRLRLWGRLVHRWRGEPERRGPDTRPLAAAGRRVGSAAVALAIVLPLLVPGLRQHRLFSGSGSGNGNGYGGQISLPNPVDELNQQLHRDHAQVVLTYRSTDGSPPYLPIYVLDLLGPRAWTMAPPRGPELLGKGNLPPVPGLARGTAGTVLRETISLSSRLTSKGGVSYLPLPYVARSVKVTGGGWRVDRATLTVFASTSLAGLRYTVTSDDVEPSRQQLREAPAPPASLRGHLYVPRGFRVLSSLAHKIVKGQATAFDKAMALQRWFLQTGNFTYSLHAPSATSPAGLIQFLKHTKTGYCQQFAFAFAVLARILGIPSRVVVGYTQGTYFAGYWQVKTSDAHAWPELYFPGAGWLRFEPTPSGSPGHAGQATATPPTYTVASGLPGTPGPPSLPSVQNPGGKAPNITKAHGGEGQISRLEHPSHVGGSGKGHRAGDAATIALVALAVLAGLLLTPRVTRTVNRRLRWWRATDDAARAHAAWREMRDDLTDYRFECRASESPRAVARRAARALGLSGAQREALDRIASAEERATYAPSPAGSASLAKDVAAARRAIAHACGPRARISAALMPLSALAPANTGLQHALDIFGWMDVVTSKIGARARRGEHPVAIQP